MLGMLTADALRPARALRRAQCTEAMGSLGSVSLKKTVVPSAGETRIEQNRQ
jgi:hypothetical protein